MLARRSAAIGLIAAAGLLGAAGLGASNEATLSPAVATVRVTGRVTDAATSAPLARARIAVGNHSTSSDSEGRFEFGLPPGRWSLEAKAEGYVPAHVDIELREGQRSEIDIQLAHDAPLRERIDVVADAERSAAPAAATALPPRQVLAVAGGGENVFRVLQTLPGVTGTDEFSSRLSVRGGGPDQNLTVMDGVEIHNPYRLFGLASAFNPETVDRFELTAGAFSARYGDRLSSLLVVDNRAGSSERTLTGSAGLSLTDTNVILEGKLPSRRGSWLLTGRRTYYDLVAERFTSSKLPSFGDLQVKTVINLGKGSTLSLLGLRSRERTDASFDIEDQAAKGAIFARSRNDLLAATFHAPLGTRGWLRTIGSLYANTDSFDFGGSFRNDERRSNAPGNAAFATARVAMTWDYTVRDRALRQEVGFQPLPSHILDAGFEIHRLPTEVQFTISGDRNETESNGSSLQGGTSLPNAFVSPRADTRLGTWIQDRWQVSSALTVEPGLRLDRSTINGSTDLSPRLAATWRLNANSRLRAAFGLHTQSPGYEKLIQSDYFADFSASGQLPVQNERARHALVAIERDLESGLQARVEGYYKGFDRLIVGRVEAPAETRARLAQYDFPAELAWSLPTDPWVTTAPTNDGRGHAWGFDLYLARRAASPRTRLTGWASYTYGVANRESFGRTYPFDYDRRHAVSVVASYRPSPRWEIAATLRAASGFPYTPVLGLRVAATPDTTDLDGDGNRSEFVPERDSEGRLVYTTYRGGFANLNSARMPYYARLDTRATYTPAWGRGRVRFYLDVMNILNRKNAGIIVSKLAYDPTSDRPAIHDSRDAAMPFLPSFGIHVTFGTPVALSSSKPKASDCGSAERPCAQEHTPRPGGFAIALRPSGTQGVGVDLIRSLSRRFNLRLGVGGLSTLKYSETASATKYDVRMRLGAASALFDWHPFAGSFHLSTGMYASWNRFELAAKSADAYNLGTTTYTTSEVGTLAGTASAPHRLAPYFGLGWGNPTQRARRIGFCFNLGVVPQGAPEVALTSSGPLANDPTLQRDLAREAKDVQGRLRGWRILPVLSGSLSYKL